ncbi:MAG TPA: phosphoglycerate kinase [Caulobacteraceae bacterium]|nr:phosphoglycerate kinase [Caulobacteraceae bacterium]
MSLRSLDGVDVAGKRVLVRVDFNVPMHDGELGDDTRLKAALPTIRRLQQGGARTILLSHFDRPKGRRIASLSLRPVAAALSRLLDCDVAFAEDCVGEPARRAVQALAPGAVLLLENLRFHAGEEANDAEFARALAGNGDLYVDDAFSAAHRAHASTEALAHLLPAYAGEAMRRELEALDRALGSPRRPVLGIVGGSKVSTKLDLLHNLIRKLDRLCIGGGMANTFLAAQGWSVGASLVEHDLEAEARGVMAFAEKRGCGLLLPIDVVAAQNAEPGGAAHARNLGELKADERILDVGPATVDKLCGAMDEAATLIWNGPVGVFETPPFDRGTLAIARQAAALAKAGKLVAIAGGGDTVAALNAAGVAGDFTFVSTAGGAFLEWIEGKRLPGLEALNA